MSLTATITGTVDTSDLDSMVIKREGVDLVGYVTYKVEIDGVMHQRTASWTLTGSQKTAITSDFVDSAKQAVSTALGL